MSLLEVGLDPRLVLDAPPGGAQTAQHQTGAPLPLPWAPAGPGPEPETDGLVDPPLPSPMLQPWEVTDRALFRREMVRVFARSWVWIGDTQDLREPGDYVAGRVGLQSVLAVRQADGSVRAFLNTCRHRASALVPAEAGSCGKALVCAYHGWSYGFDGRLLGIPDQSRMYGDGLDLAEHGLVEIRCEVAWDTLVFVTLSERAPAFREWIAPLAQRYDSYRFDTFHRYHRDLDQTYDINWKVFVENSNDDYHVRFVHRRLNTIRRNRDTVVRFEGRTTSGYKPHTDADNPAGGRTDLAPEALSGHYAEFIYPNLTPLPYPTELILVRADPLSPTRTRLFSRVYGLATDTAEQDKTIAALELTNREDTDMVTVLMANLESPFYRVGPASTWEARAAHVNQLIRHDVATPLAADEFAKES